MKHVLLLEDEHEISIMLRQALEAQGYYVTYTPRLADAMSLLDRMKFDILIADVILPDGIGTKATDRARQKDIPFLLMTGSIERMAELEANGEYFLAKPFRLAPFMAQVVAKAGAPPNTGAHMVAELSDVRRS
jgi:DNA-binding response OmpR family regulator